MRGGNTNATWLVQALARSITTSSAAAAAAPAIATKSSSSFLTSLGFGSGRIDTPLTAALPTAPLKGASSTVSAPKLQSSALASGTKVVAVESPGPISSISLVFGAGAAHESEAAQGASKVLEQLAFKASASRTTFCITRELEKVGAVATASVGRDHISYNVSASKLSMPEVVEVLLDSALNAKLNYWEVQEAIAAAKAKLTLQLQDPKAVLSDVLHHAAFDGPLGLPLLPDPSALDHLSKEALQGFLASTLVPSNTVLAAAGVGLDEFAELAGPLVGASQAAGKPPAAPLPASSYVGGSLNVLAPAAGAAWVGLAFEAAGGLGDTKGAAVAAVARALLQGGAGVVPHADKGADLLVGASTFGSLYGATGLVGLIAAAAPGQVPALVDAATSKLEGLAKVVPEPRLKAAKQAVVGAFKASTSSAAGLASMAAPQLLLAGKFSPAEYMAAVESLSAADVAGYVSEALKSAPTYVTYGSLGAKVPRYDAVAKRFG